MLKARGTWIGAAAALATRCTIVVERDETPPA